jgi:predicted O-methyltransferase YrrM
MRPPRFYRSYDYDRALLPNRHLQKLEKGVRDLESAKKKTGMTIGYPGWGVLYYLLLSHLDPDADNVVIETGTNVGCSTIILAQALRDSGRRGTVYSFEIQAREHSEALHNISAAGLADRVRLFNQDAREGLRELLPGLGEIRVAFLDGSHLLDEVLTEFELVLPRLAPDAIVIFDNTYRIADEGEDPRVNGALKIIAARHGGNLINLPFVSWFTSGLAMWQRAPAL